MKENKPLLFINSAQSNKVNGPNQYVYDSRYHQKQEFKKVVKPKELPKQEKKEEIRELEPQEVIEEVEEVQEEIQEVTEQEDKHQSKLLNKMDLLNKRAQLERYVLVSVITKEEEYEGYFIKKDKESILLRFENGEEIEIKINEIDEILILRV